MASVPAAVSLSNMHEDGRRSRENLFSYLISYKGGGEDLSFIFPNTDNKRSTMYDSLADNCSPEIVVLLIVVLHNFTKFLEVADMRIEIINNSKTLAFFSSRKRSTVKYYCVHTHMT